MDPNTPLYFMLMIGASWLLGFVLMSLWLYLIIRLAVTHSARSQWYWERKQAQAVQNRRA